MKRGFRALAVLAAVAVTSAGPAAFAGCGDFGGFAIFQCGDRAYFNPPPAGAGAVSSVFWQIGYGNNTLNDGSGTSGYGTYGVDGLGAGAFNGNDSGTFPIELRDARTATGSSLPPAGSLCFGSNNWANTGIDGCCDNPRDPLLQISDDGILNPLYNVQRRRNGDGVFSANTQWVQDSPMMALLRESTGRYIAVAAVSTLKRSGTSDDRPGSYNFRDVNDGLANLITAEPNVVPWQVCPGWNVNPDPNRPTPQSDLVHSTTFDPNDRGASHILDLGWNDVTVYSDNALRTSTNATVTGGLGTAQVGPLVRYVVETQGVVDPNDAIGSLLPNGWTAVGTFTNPTNSTQVVVAADTCVRLRTYFGANPPGTFDPNNTDTCRVGECGDLGYECASPPACLGGPLVSESPIELKAIRERAGAITITWKSSAELTTTAYKINAVTKKGSVTLGTVPATATGSGMSASYKFKAAATQLKGTRTIEIVAIPSGAKQRVQIQ